MVVDFVTVLLFSNSESVHPTTTSTTTKNCSSVNTSTLSLLDRHRSGYCSFYNSMIKSLSALHTICLDTEIFIQDYISVDLSCSCYKSKTLLTVSERVSLSKIRKTLNHKPTEFKVGVSWIIVLCLVLGITLLFTRLLHNVALSIVLIRLRRKVLIKSSPIQSVLLRVLKCFF